MKAGTKLLRAASAVAISSAVLTGATLSFQMATTESARAQVINQIVVQGNQRVQDETVRNLVSISPGQNVTDFEIDEAVRRLFATGLFADVRISQSGGSLIVEVEENQIVNQVLFQGNDRLKDAQLEAIVQTSQREPFSQATVQADVAAIKEAYIGTGRSDAVVTARTVPVEANRVNVVFDIQEGERTKIESIQFVGNNAFGDRRLSEVISLRESGLFSFISSNDIYDEARLRADEEALRRFYYNRGYADFRIVSSVAELDEAQNQYFITITVDEGERYTFGNINIDSTIPGIDVGALRGELETQTGEVYSAEDVEETLVNLTNALAAQGYAFAQVTPRGDRDFTRNTISVDYVIDQGPRAYVERIQIRGNTKTRDYVIRREFDVSEGDAFNQVLIQRAKQRLENLGFFQTVEVSTAPGSEPDRVIVIVDVQEQATGEFSLGGGYTTGGDNAGPVAEVGVQERNFLGRGQFIKLSAGFGSDTRRYNLSFTEPYFLGRRLAAGFDIYRTESETSSYRIERTGGSLRLAAPITEDLSAQVSYNIKSETFEDDDEEDLRDEVFPNLASSCSNFEDEDNLGAPAFTRSPIINEAICDSPYLTSSISYALTYNTLDSAVLPREGILAAFGQEVAGVGGDAQFVKSSVRASYFQLLSEEYDVVGQLSAGAGNVFAFGDDLRVFDNFFKGQDIVRGFEYNGIGPRQNGVALGGTNYVNASAEATFPLPVVPRDLGFRGAVFADAGSLWGTELEQENFLEGDGTSGLGSDDIFGEEFALRSSVGVGLIWASPFGPLRVNYAHPLQKEEFDETQELSFGFSTRF